MNKQPLTKTTMNKEIEKVEDIKEDIEMIKSELKKRGLLYFETELNLINVKIESLLQSLQSTEEKEEKENKGICRGGHLEDGTCTKWIGSCKKGNCDYYI